MKKLLLAALISLHMNFIYAAQIYSALIPENGDAHVLVTIVDRACDSKAGNATITSSTYSIKGCWIQEGPAYRVTLIDTNEVKVYPRSEFKFMGDTVAQSTNNSIENKLMTVLTCVADAWAGDVTVERNSDGSLKTVFVSGEKVNATEQANAINFTFNGLNISLSTLTGVFNYETSGFQSFINNQMRRSNTKGAGLCKINNSAKKF